MAIHSAGEVELEEHDDANIPCNLFISELDEEDAQSAKDEHELDFIPKWELRFDLFMPRKGLMDSAGTYFAETREELQQLVKEKILPSYKIAFDAITAMAEGKRDDFYYWTPNEKPKQTAIVMKVLDTERQQFLVQFEHPGRIEVSKSKSGDIFAHIYEGAEVDMEQEPVGAFDGTLTSNTGWVVVKKG